MLAIQLQPIGCSFGCHVQQQRCGGLHEWSTLMADHAVLFGSWLMKTMMIRSSSSRAFLSDLVSSGC